MQQAAQLDGLRLTATQTPPRHTWLSVVPQWADHTQRQVSAGSLQGSLFSPQVR